MRMFDIIQNILTICRGTRTSDRTPPNIGLSVTSGQSESWKPCKEVNFHSNSRNISVLVGLDLSTDSNTGKQNSSHPGKFCWTDLEMAETLTLTGSCSSGQTSFFVIVAEG
ncbi:hypothetical protein CHARACLAT_031012 [Characodon lateralis]|uniref:Uncharacterized protein n=1 Tax=Characodon lateralis TaxID=208331 RepID=A0ABU7DDC8_9TELE|nr:hypothetical protein [Characodon lateralis]